MDQRDLSRTYFREIKELYDFVAEQVTAGLFKSDIIDKLIELGVDRYLAFDVLEEMERRLSKMRKRLVVLVISDNAQREVLRKEFWMSGYDILLQENLKEFEENLTAKVPDLVVADAFDIDVKGRDVLHLLRSSIVGRRIPVFILSEETLSEEAFKKWDKVWIFSKPCDEEHIVHQAKEFFLKKFLGEE